MLSPTIHEIRPRFPSVRTTQQRSDRIFVLSLDRHCGSLYVVAPEEITLIDSFHAKPDQQFHEFLKTVDEKVFETLRRLKPTFCLAAKPLIRQKYELISRLPQAKHLNLDRYFSPRENFLLHRTLMARLWYAGPSRAMPQPLHS